MSQNVNKFLRFFAWNVSRILRGMSKILKLSATLKNHIRDNNQPLKATQNLYFVRKMYRKLLDNQLLVIIKSRVTSSDITSPSNRTLELKQLDPNYMSVKFHDYSIIRLGFRDHSSHPILTEKKLKSQKNLPNLEVELRMVPLRTLYFEYDPLYSFYLYNIILWSL